MNQITISIDDFPSDGAPWRIDGLGKLHGSGQLASEPLIDIHLSQLLPNYDDPLSNLSLGGPSMRIPIKVGLISLLKPGSVWINKVRRMPERPYWLETTINPAQVELRNWGSRFDFEGQNVPLIASSQFRVPKNNWLGLADSWVVVIRRPLPNVPYLVIPSSVIFQKCLAESPEGVRRILQGNLNRIIDNPCSIETTDGKKAYFVEVFKEIRTVHAYAYANLAADPNGMREYARLRRSLVAASVNETILDPRGHQTYINLGFPFSNPMRIRFHGKAMPFRKNPNAVKPEYAFFATEIVTLDVRLVFDRLIVHRKNSNDKGKNAGDPDLKSAWPSPPASEIDLNGVDSVPAVSDEEPLSALEKLLAEEAGGFKALNLEVIKDRKLTQEYRRKVIDVQSKSAFNGTTATGNPRSGSQGAAELDLQTDEAPRVPVTLESFIETLQVLRDAGHPFETRVVAPIHRFNDNADVVNFFPRHIKHSRSWHLVSDNPHAPPRGYIVATLRSGGAWHHLIEIQRKEEKGRSLAYIRTNDGSLIEARQIRLFMVDVAYKRGWNACSFWPNWTLTTINHSPKKGNYHFACAIANAIGVNCPGIERPPRGPFPQTG